MTNEYIQRRQLLRNRIGTGIILLPGNNNTPINYPSNHFPFRQDSNVLYFSGIDKPGIVLLIDCDNNNEILFGNNPDTDDIIWSGPQTLLSDVAELVGIKHTLSLSKLAGYISVEINKNRTIHYLPPYTASRKILLSKLLNKPIDDIEVSVSKKLIEEIVKLRSVKSVREIEEIENALNTSTGLMHLEALKMAKPGFYEYEIAANISCIAAKNNVRLAYPSICTVHGETLHNEGYNNKLTDGQLLLVDAAAESPLHYASDITRTFPVGGNFSTKQKEIYEVVLSAQLNSIDMIKPGKNYIDIHNFAARIIIEGLTDIGLMKGNTDEALELGAHALFFPHGLGHMLGLDVHDMEDLGENFVGYSDHIKRSDQFGKSFLRFARKLEQGFTITVEPGIYFIPALIDLWYSKKKFVQFINYEKVFDYKNFGGVRIEDNILVTPEGCKVLGNPIPKQIHEIEHYC